MNTLTIRTLTVRAFALSAVVLLTGLARTVRAQEVVQTNKTINYTAQGVYVGRSPGYHDTTSPTVSLVAPCSLDWMETYNQSKVKMYGGKINQIVNAHDTSAFTFSNGYINWLAAYDNSSIYMSGGSTNELDAIGRGYVCMSGGVAGRVYGDDDYNYTTSGNCTILITGGDVQNSVEAHGHTHLVCTNGATIEGSVLTYDATIYYQTGGDIQYNLNVNDYSTAYIYGGRVEGSISANTSSNITIMGGTIDTNLVGVHNSSTVTFMGKGLTATLLNANVWGSSWYSVSGTLRDGTKLNGLLLVVQNGSNAKFNLINN